jgi:hypothetical protein
VKILLNDAHHVIRTQPFVIFSHFMKITAWSNSVQIKRTPNIKPSVNEDRHRPRSFINMSLSTYALLEGCLEKYSEEIEHLGYIDCVGILLACKTFGNSSHSTILILHKGLVIREGILNVGYE